MKVDLNSLTRNFILQEGKKGSADPNALLQAIKEVLENVRPRSRTDKNRILVAQAHLREVVSSFRKLQERVNLLEEKLQVLEEISTMAGGSVQGAAAPLGIKDEKDD